MTITTLYSEKVLELKRRLGIPTEIFFAELAKVVVTLGPVPIGVPLAVPPGPPVFQPLSKFHAVDEKSNEDFTTRASAFRSQSQAIVSANMQEQDRYDAERVAFDRYQDYIASIDRYLSDIESHMQRELHTPEPSPSPPPSRKRRRVGGDVPQPGGRPKRNSNSLAKSGAELAKDLETSGLREIACSYCVANGKTCLADPKGKGACKECQKRKTRCALPTPPIEIPPEVAADLHALRDLLSKTCVSLGNIEALLVSHSLHDQHHTKVLEDLTCAIKEYFPNLLGSKMHAPQRPQSSTPSSLGPRASGRG